MSGLFFGSGGGGGGLTGVSSASNGLSGYDVNVNPSNTAVPNDLLRSASIVFGTGNFAGQRYADPVVAFGYNQALGTGVDDIADPVASGYWSENDYSVDVSLGTSLTAGTTTTSAVVTGAAFADNRYIGFVLFNVTRAIAGGSSANDATGTYSRRITANTSTTLTLESAIPGQTSGDVIQIHRRDMELYMQFNEAYGAGPTYRGIRPFMYTLDKSSLSNHTSTITLSSGTNANPPVLTASAPHKLAVGDFVRFEALTGGTWNANLEHRSRRVSAVTSTTFTLDNVNSTGFGALTGGNVYVEPSISSAFLLDRNSGLRFSTASWRGDQVPAGDTAASGLALRFVGGILQIYPADSVNTGIELRSGSSLRGGIAGVSTFYQQYNNLAAGGWTASFTSYYSASVFNASGAGETQAMALFRNNSENWGGAFIGNNSGTFGSGVALFGIDGISVPASRPLVRIQQQASPAAAAHPLAVYNTSAVLQHFIDGLGNWVPRATAGATGDTNGFFYVPSVAGAPSGTPANVTGNYANAVPMRYDSTNNRLYLFAGGAWRYRSIDNT